MYNIYLKWKLENLYKNTHIYIYESEFSCCWFSCTIYDKYMNTYLRYKHLKKKKQNTLTISNIRFTNL